MPRAVWLAIGAVAAAWQVPAIGPAAWAVACAVGLTVVVAGRVVKREHAATMSLAAVVGFIAIGMRIVLASPVLPAGSAGLPDGSGPWTMRVETVGSPRDGQQTATLTSVVGSAPAMRVAATLPAYPAVMPGDVVTVSGSIRPPPDSPYGAYLRRIEADGTLRARAMTVEAAGDDPGRTLEHLRRSAGWALAAILPEPEAGLAAGILIGLRDLVDRDLAAAFTTAGVSHVVAISGWNIAIVAAAVGACAGRLGRRRRSVVTIVAIVAYVVVAGASASVVRAGLMAGVVLLARESGRAGQAATALGWTVGAAAARRPGAGPRCRAPAVSSRDGGVDRLGDTDRRGTGADRAWAPARVAHREPRRLAGGPGGDAAAHPRLVRAAVARGARGQPARRPARRPGDGGRTGGAGCRDARHRRSAVGGRGDPRGSGLGAAACHGLDRPGKRRLAVRQRHARPAPGRADGGGRRWPDRRTPPAIQGTWPHVDGGPVAHACHAAGADGRFAIRRRPLGIRALDPNRRPRDSPSRSSSPAPSSPRDRPESRASPCSTWGRVTRS